MEWFCLAASPGYPGWVTTPPPQLMPASPSCTVLCVTGKLGGRRDESRSTSKPSSCWTACGKFLIAIIKCSSGLNEMWPKNPVMFLIYFPHWLSLLAFTLYWNCDILDMSNVKYHHNYTGKIVNNDQLPELKRLGNQMLAWTSEQCK